MLGLKLNHVCKSSPTCHCMCKIVAWSDHYCQCSKSIRYYCCILIVSSSFICDHFLTSFPSSSDVIAVWRRTHYAEQSQHTRLCGGISAKKTPGPWFNIKMSSYRYRKSHCGDKTVVRSSYLHNGISYTGKMSSLYWIGAQCVSNGVTSFLH